MNPRLRFNAPLFFQEFRAMIDAIPEAHKTEHDAICDGCGSRLFLSHGRHSGKWFFSHQGLAGCEVARSVMFDTKGEALNAREVFQ